MRVTDDFFLYWATAITFVIMLMIQVQKHLDNREPETSPVNIFVEISLPESVADTPSMVSIETVSSEDLMCLATNIYHEARGSTVQDQVATAQVVLNRVTDPRWPDSICGVVWQANQFSWTADNLSDAVTERESWNRARYLAEMVLTGMLRDQTDGADHYHAHYVSPRWAERGFAQVDIGAHRFMKVAAYKYCLLYTSPSPRDQRGSRMPSSA